jgi:Putative Actinobacterial Holin-X, holin superfamily III
VAINDPVAASAGTDASAANAAPAEPTTGRLVRGIVDDATRLVRQEVLLARQELTEGAVATAKASALLAAAALLSLYGLGFLLFAVAVAVGGPEWLGFLLVGGVLAAGAGVLGLLGRRRLAASKIAPERAAAELRQTASELKEEIRRG